MTGDEEPEPYPGWRAAFRSEGFGKSHAAREGERAARCGAPVNPPRIAIPFRPGVSRCAGCQRLLDKDQAAEESTRNAGHAEFTE